MKQQEFDKLPQLSRVEYLLRSDRIKERYFSFNDFIGSLWTFSYLGITALMFGLLFYIAFDEIAPLVAFAELIGIMLEPVFFILIIIWIISFMLEARNLKWLDKRFKK